MAANHAHFEKLLSDAGVKAGDVDALYASAGIGRSSFMRTTALRAELHNRGILPIAGRTVPGAGQEASAEELVQGISQVTKQLDSLSAKLPAAATATPAAMVTATVADLRAEMKTLAHRLDAASIKRKAEVLRTIRQMENGTFDAAGSARAVQLRSDLATLSGAMDQTSTQRKGAICQELRTLPAA